ncbi:MAG: DUF4230 domain-containing protein [Lachnospiraceae bacterium]|nr:DUF4230 domain-containing protein [Lachnospiraceae bacterium]
MKKILMMLLAMAIILCCGCEKKEEKVVEPQVTEMRYICELATMDCYYHSVVKENQKEVEHFLWWDKDRKFWMEYTGIVTVGIDASLVSIEIVENRVKITVPNAKVLSYKIDEQSFNEDSIIVDKNSVDITAEDQVRALKQAEVDMVKGVNENRSILENAEMRVQQLLEDYVNNIGELVGKQYQIEWVHIEDVSQKESSNENQE